MAQFACVSGITADRLMVPEIDTNSPSSEAHPAGRRFAALLVDLAFVFLPSVIIAAVVSERFSIVDVNTNGRPQFDLADQQRINEIDEGLNRALRLGDSIYTLSGSGLILTVFAVVALTGVVFFGIPAARKGLTPGRVLLHVPGAADPEHVAQVIAVSWSDDEDGDDDSSDDTGGDDQALTDIESPDTELLAGDEVPDPDDPVKAREGRLELDDQPEDTTELDLDRAPGSVPGGLNHLDDLFSYERQSITMPVTLGDEDDYSSWDADLLDLPAANSKSNSKSARTFDHLTLPESSLSESSLTATTNMLTREHEESATLPTQTPEWNDEWQAWVYRDQATDRWFRHDTTEDRWVPLS